MQLMAALSHPRERLLNRRSGAIAGVLGLGAALSIAVAADHQLSKAVANGVQEGVSGVKTVAAMLADRSPGQRPSGALAKLKQLKHKRAAAVAPLSRHMLPPVAGVLESAAVPLVLPPPLAPAPPFAVVAGGPPVVIPPVVSGGGGGGGGPPFFAESPPGGGGGGGGGIITPPSTEVVTPPPATSSVPEPASWGMMLVGFAMLGGLIRRQKGTGARVASS